VPSPAFSQVSRPGIRTAPLFVAFIAAAVAGVRQADAQADPAMETAQRLLQRTYVAAREAPLSKNAEAGEIVAALRSSGDKDLLPFFLKMRDSKSTDNQIFGMVAATILAKQSGMDPESTDFNYLDLSVLLGAKDPALVGSALASLIDAEALSLAQLRVIVAKAPDASHRAMAAGELNRLHKLDDRSSLADLLKNEKEIVRYYAAMTMLSGPESEQKSALSVLHDMTEANDLRQAAIQALMLVRMQKESITAGIPWAAQVAADEKSDEGLRYTAVATLLSLKAPDGVAILGDMIGKQKDALQQVKLGLIAIEYGAQLKPQVLAPLLNSKSSLAKSIALIAQKSASGADITADLISLLKEGHPIVLDWALAYCDRADPDRRLAIRTAIVNQATIVDGQRDRDYERAALAAQKILHDDGDAGRRTITNLLRSERRPVVEATLAGLFRSDAKNQSELIPMAVWDGLIRVTSAEVPANYAALIFAREGRKEALAWLPQMIQGGTTQGAGLRALAGWYYAKLKGQDAALLAAVLAG
jgi:hypothetical protein